MFRVMDGRTNAEAEVAAMRDLIQDDHIRILSLGWGVQSWTLAAMVALGELPPVDFMVHANTTWEHEATVEFARQWTPWLGEHGQNVVTIQSPRTELLQSWPGGSISVQAPVFTLSPDGAVGKTQRRCTRDWKVIPIRQFASRELMAHGLKKTPGVVQMAMGISIDEWSRIRDSEVKYIEHEYPLVDARISRRECSEWLARHDLPVPRKSSCVFCPYKNRASWENLGRKGGVDLEVAIAVDEAIRDAAPDLLSFVHPSMRPLAEAVKDQGQTELWPDASCDSGHCFT
jgi:hypothetical protein